MTRRLERCAPLALALVLLAAPVHAAHRFYDDSKGFFVWIEAGLARLGNADRTLGLSRSAGAVELSRPLTLDWNEQDVAAAGIGYRWGSNTLALRYWSFDDDVRLVADGPSGGRIIPAASVPALPDGNPGHLDVEASLEAELLDVTWTHVDEIGELFDLSWSVGFRYAALEETAGGTYDLCARGGCDPPSAPGLGFGDVRFDVSDRSESDMAGLRVAVGGSYHFATALAVSSQIGLSALTGEIESLALQVPTGATHATDPPARLEAEDDDRSGEIVDLEVAFHWFLAGDRVRLTLGYATQRWDGLADRDDPSFSTVFLAARYEF